MKISIELSDAILSSTMGLVTTSKGLIYDVVPLGSGSRVDIVELVPMNYPGVNLLAAGESPQKRATVVISCTNPLKVICGIRRNVKPVIQELVAIRDNIPIFFSGFVLAKTFHHKALH